MATPRESHLKPEVSVNYDMTDSTTDTETTGLLSKREEHLEASNNWIVTTVLIIAAMAGAGMLALPGAVNSAGWIGILLLLICAIVAIYTGIRLGQLMEKVPQLHDYAEVGEAAFGRFGRIISQFSLYVTSGGVSVIFLVLLGLLLNGIFPKIPHGFWTLVLGAGLIPVIALLRTVSEARWMGYLAMIATAIVAVIVLIQSGLLVNNAAAYSAFVQQQNVTHEIAQPATMAVGFGVFTFAYGTHTYFPTMYVKMSEKQYWPRAVVVSFSVVTTLYVVVGAVGYYVFGSFLANTDTMLDAVSQTSVIGPGLVITGQVCIALHVAAVLPILANPVFLAIEHKWTILQDSAPRRYLARSLVFALFIVIALFFPYFTDVMSLISDISMSLAVYILPPLFYWKLMNPPAWEKVLLALVIAFGLLGSGVGIYDSIVQLILDVKKHPNPFDGLFHFG